MKRLALILFILVLSYPLYGQYSWRFSPSYTFDAPAFSKEDLSSRAEDFRRYATVQLNAPDIYQYDSKHHTSWFLFSDQIIKVKNREYDTVIKMYVSILPDDGKYTVIAEKCEASARSHGRALFEFEILRSDDSVYTDNRTKEVVLQIKSFLQEQFDGQIPIIREIMETPVDRFRLHEVTD